MLPFKKKREIDKFKHLDKIIPYTLIFFFLNARLWLFDHTSLKTLNARSI